MRRFTILLADDELSDKSYIETTLAGGDYYVVFAGDHAQCLAKARDLLPDLVLLNPQIPMAYTGDPIQTVRSAFAPLGTIPVLCCSTTRHDIADLYARGFDGQVPKPYDPADLLPSIAAWNPVGTMVGIERLERVFGTTAMSALLTRFRKQLADAVAELDVAIDLRTAHRIAGIAGTLGFDRVGESWLRLSESGDTRDEARRNARIAIYQIDLSQTGRLGN